jgi:hypothetical protein
MEGSRDPWSESGSQPTPPVEEEGFEPSVPAPSCGPMRRCRRGLSSGNHIGERIGNIVGKSFGKPPVVARRTRRNRIPVTSRRSGPLACRRSWLADDL